MDGIKDNKYYEGLEHQNMFYKLVFKTIKNAQTINEIDSSIRNLEAYFIANARTITPKEWQGDDFEEIISRYKEEPKGLLNLDKLNGR